MANRNIKVLSDRDHIYQKTEMYAGGVSEVESIEYLMTDAGIRRTQVSYVPALLKIINEVIDNAVDVHIKTPTAAEPVVDVKMTETTVTVRDNGCGIPVQKNEDGIYLPRVCWGFARSGGNFDLKENAGLGTFGVGSYITNVLSTRFKGCTCDGSKKYTVTFTNNAGEYEERVSTGSDAGTVVEFDPDLGRFCLTSMGHVYSDLVRQRLLNLKMAFPQLTFKLNGKAIKVSSFKSYCQQFNLPFEMYEADDGRFSFAVMHNPEDDFQQFSYVNGLSIKDGGTHIDAITSNVVDRIREKLLRKYKTIKPGDIRNKLFVVAFCRSFPNPKFNSQTKEKITNSPSEVAKYFDCPWDAVAAKILKNVGIIDPITEVHKIKEEMKRRQDLKSLSKVRKIKNEKYLPPTRKQKYLMIVEGECLEENTPVLMATMDSMPLKDLEVGDYVLDRFMQPAEVQAITKLLKPVVEVKTAKGAVKCSKKHRFYYYNKEEKKFGFKAVEELKPGVDCLVHSRINSDTKGAKVYQNYRDLNVLEVSGDHISYTADDVFTIMRDGLVIKVPATDIVKDDVICYTLA